MITVKVSTPMATPIIEGVAVRDTPVGRCCGSGRTGRESRRKVVDKFQGAVVRVCRAVVGSGKGAAAWGGRLAAGVPGGAAGRRWGTRGGVRRVLRRCRWWWHRWRGGVGSAAVCMVPHALNVGQLPKHGIHI